MERSNGKRNKKLRESDSLRDQLNGRDKCRNGCEREWDSFRCNGDFKDCQQRDLERKRNLIRNLRRDLLRKD